MKPRPWRLRRPLLPGPEPWRGLASAWDLPPAAARLAWLRGLDHPEDLAWRLDASWERTTDPFLLPGVGEAVGRIRRALEAKERVLVYGDYDVDGVTATALLVRVLERLGATVDFFIPNRFSDGYGLHLDCVEELVQTRRPTLAVSVDCGIRSADVVAASREWGLDWVVTDHHALPEALPPAAAVVHPALGGYSNPCLAGVGVAFKLAQALLDAAPVPREGDRPFLDALLKLVALGTVADMVPLAGENALLARRGLQSLGGGNAPGLAALLRAARIQGVPRAQDIAFGVAPRLNAVGRMGGAEDAVRLLLCRDGAEAAHLMEKVEALNAERRAVQRELERALPPFDGAPFDLVVHPGAHKGVLGILAGRRMRETELPTAVCTVEEGITHCSLRAPEGYDLGALLDLAGPYLRTAGGHRVAAGMSFEISRLSFVRQTLLRGAAAQADGLGPVALPVDGWGPDDIPLAEVLDRLEPFGMAFPTPRVVLEGAVGRDVRGFGDGHVRFTVGDLKESLVWFHAPEPWPESGASLCLACSPSDHGTYGRSWTVDMLVLAEVPA